MEVIRRKAVQCSACGSTARQIVDCVFTHFPRCRPKSEISRLFLHLWVHQRRWIISIDGPPILYMAWGSNKLNFSSSLIADIARIMRRHSLSSNWFRKWPNIIAHLRQVVSRWHEPVNLTGSVDESGPYPFEYQHNIQFLWRSAMVWFLKCGKAATCSSRQHNCPGHCRMCRNKTARNSKGYRSLTILLRNVEGLPSSHRLWMNVDYYNETSLQPKFINQNDGKRWWVWRSVSPAS